MTHQHVSEAKATKRSFSSFSPHHVSVFHIRLKSAFSNPFFSPSLAFHSVSNPPVELGECDFSKGVSTGLEGCSSGRSEGASQTFHLRSYAPEALCSLERQLPCQVASCAMTAQLLFYCSFLMHRKKHSVHFFGKVNYSAIVRIRGGQ